MIVFIVSLVLLVNWTVIIWQGLRMLQREQQAATKRPWGDHFVSERNRRAVYAFVFWSTIVTFFVTSAQYVDIRFLELARIAGTTERFLLLVASLILLWDRWYGRRRR